MIKKIAGKLEILARRYSNNSIQRKKRFEEFSEIFLENYQLYRKFRIKEKRAAEMAIKNSVYKIEKNFEKPNLCNYFLDTYIDLRKEGLDEKNSYIQTKFLTEIYSKEIVKKILEKT
jgi:hypothetical protein